MPLPANIHDAPIAHKADGSDPYAWLQERDTKAAVSYTHLTLPTIYSV